MSRRSTVVVIEPNLDAHDLLRDVLSAVRFDPTFMTDTTAIPKRTDLVIYSQREDVKDSELKVIANQLRRLSKAPIVLMDGQDSDNVRNVLLRRWFDEVVVLPVDTRVGNLTRWTKDLVRAMRSVLNTKADKQKEDEDDDPASSPVRNHVASVRLKGEVPECIAIGISTGGPVALGKLWPDLDPEILPPIFVVQHMPEDFVKGFAERLGNESLIPTKIPTQNEIALPGHAYIAPGDRHLVIDRYLGDLRMRFSDDEPMTGHRPSADKLFYSLADHRIPTLGVIMTGMGADGTLGLMRLHEQKCHIIGQAEASCAVYGMPKMACEAGAVDQEMSLGKLPVYINNLFVYINRKRKV